MKKSPLLLYLLKTQFMIDRDYLYNNHGMIDSLLNGTIDVEADRPSVKAIGSSPSAELIAVSGETMVDFSRVPQDSVMILPIHGPMLRYGGLCSWGMVDVAETLAQAATNKNIVGAIIDLDSPGGGVDAIAPVIQGIEAMRAAGKPVGVLFETMASAAVYGFSGANFVWANNDISAQFGSIGVMAVLNDATKAEEDSGRKKIIIYAPQSTEKNKAVEMALAGDTSIFEEEILSPLAEKFIADFKSMRPQLVDDGKILAGKMYYAQDALKLKAFDKIGTLSEAIAEVRKLSGKKSGSAGTGKAKAQNQIQNLNMKYAKLLTALALASLEISEGKASLSKEQVDTLMASYKKASGKDLTLKDINFDNEGFAQLTETDLSAIEQLFEKITPAAAEEDNTPALEDVVKRLGALEASNKEKDSIIAALGNKPVELQMQKVDKVIRMVTKEKRELMISGGYVFGETNDWNKVDAKRPYNQALEALIRGDYDQSKIFAATDVDLSQLNSDLGAFISGRKGDIIEWFNPNDELEAIFPTLAGVKEGDFFVSVEMQEVIQQYQKGWTPKGGYKFHARKPILRDIKFDLELENLKSIERTWLNEFNKEGSAAYKMTFVEYLVSLAIRKGVQEYQIAAIKGEYKDPTTGVAGNAIHVVDGILYQISQFEAELLAKPFYTIGEWTSANILDFVSNMIAALPEDMRDRAGLGFYVSSLFIETYWEARRLQEGTMPTYDPSKSVIPGHENIRLIRIPNAGNTKRTFIAPIGLIRQLFGENESSTAGLVNVEVSKRVVNIFGDFKRNIWPTVVGAKSANATALADRDYTQQLIWYNDADYASTEYLIVDADSTTLSAKRHNMLQIPANTQATAITDITDAVTGDIVKIKIGSATNPSTIANSGKFTLTAAWEPTDVGEWIQLLRREDGEWLEIARYSGVTAEAFDADDATPSVDGGTVFITNANTTATAITTFDDAVAGTTYTIYGAGTTNASTIANSGNFVLSAAFTASTGNVITLYYNGTKFYEVSRVTA
ncbi:MAG: hypothetical protein CVU11_14100 [Bacteroidetes bacterium HGW-Bacteroidetes-6]|jgi:ClpP class serine protease|nr:MAG: hypothetical protein CVU11_14100 [Bacteroidetes bacterium HGW-Bacteroidetes-6]